MVSLLIHLRTVLSREQKLFALQSSPLAQVSFVHSFIRQVRMPPARRLFWVPGVHQGTKQSDLGLI